MVQRGITVSYEAIRLWCNNFGSKYTQRIRRKRQGYGNTFFIDEASIQIHGKQHYLWRGAEQDDEGLMYFSRRGLTERPRRASSSSYFIYTKESTVGSSRTNCGATTWLREFRPETIHDVAQYANNRAERSYGPTSVRERGMRK